MSKKIEDFSDQELQELHDYLLKGEIPEEKARRLYKNWSKEYNRRHPKEISEIIWTNYKGIHSLKKDRSEEETPKDRQQLKTLNAIFGEKKKY